MSHVVNHNIQMERRMNVFSLQRKPLTALALIVTALWAHSASPAQSTQVVEARIVRITTTLVTLEGIGEDFKLDAKNAQCFDEYGNKLTCATLAGIGYVDKARVTIAGDVVQRIDIIDLQQ